MDGYEYDYPEPSEAEAWDVPEPLDAFPDDALTDEAWPDTPFAPLPLSQTASWSTAEPGGCWFSFVLPPVLVLLVGGLFALLALTRLPLVGSAPLPPPQPARLQAPLPAENPAGVLAPLFTPEVRHWEGDIVRWARQWNLDPNLVATVMQIESCGNPRAVSRSGAAGLFQVMPFHFQNGEDPFEPETNARRGMAYLRRALDAFSQDTRLALAGYNGGIGGASRGESAWAAETLRYVHWGTGIYEDARAGKQHSARLQAWLEAGGASLCAQARQVLGVR